MESNEFKIKFFENLLDHFSKDSRIFNEIETEINSLYDEFI